MSKFVCQMYSLRDAFAKDYRTTLKKVKAIGFDFIQLDGMRGNNPKDVAKALKECNLVVSSMHIKHDRFIFDVEGIVAETKLFDCKEVYCKYIEDEFQVEYGYKFTKYALIKAAKQLAKLGIQVGLHSPEYDFNTLVDGEKVMDYICKEKDGIFLHPEPDTYWCLLAKVKPEEYIKAYPNRILTIHCKDIKLAKANLEMQENVVECGQGDVDFTAVLRWGNQHGVQAYAVEQDYSKKDMFVSLAESLQYLRSLDKTLSS